MTFEELVMDLIIAINEEDLSSTINIVNNMSLSNEELNNLSQILSFTHEGGNYTNALWNKCIDYILENLDIPFYKNILFLRKQNRMR